MAHRTLPQAPVARPNAWKKDVKETSAAAGAGSAAIAPLTVARQDFFADVLTDVGGGEAITIRMPRRNKDSWISFASGPLDPRATRRRANQGDQSSPRRTRRMSVPLPHHHDQRCRLIEWYNPSIRRGEDSDLGASATGVSRLDATEKRYPRSGGTPPVWANNLLTIFQVPLMRDSER